MTKIDKSYLEKLGEVLHDEKKTVNYKTVSIMLGVHVNIAKQMLYHMHKTAKAEGKKIYATYYISGMVPGKVLLNMERKEETHEDATSQQSSIDPADAFLISLCREKDLEDIKSKYTKIFSVHIYSLSAFSVENYDALENLVEFPLKDCEGRTPVDFGPVICSASQKLVEKPRNTAAPINNKPKVDHVTKAVDNKNRENTNGTFRNGNSQPQDKISKEDASANAVSLETKSQKLAKPAVEKKDGNRLKSMFATAATKPKSQAKKDETAKPEVKENPKIEATTEWDEKKPKETNRSKVKESRKRKRIVKRDVLSSDSEEDSKMSEDEEDFLPESPVPRKRLQIESDSDEDFKETSKQPENLPSVKEKVVPGRKRTSKTVSKSYVDKDGYLVTTKEQVMVSEDEDAESEKKVLKTPTPEKDTLKTSANESVPKKAEEKLPVKSSNASGKSASGKTKQASLMSFFQKK